MKGRPASTGFRFKTESCKAAIDTVALRLIGDAASRNGCPTPLHAYHTPASCTAPAAISLISAAAHTVPAKLCQHQVSTLIAFLHCDLVRKAFVAKLGVRLQIRAKSWYQLFEVIQFLKLLNPIVKGSVFIRANPSGDCPRAKTYFSGPPVALSRSARQRRALLHTTWPFAACLQQEEELRQVFSTSLQPRQSGRISRNRTQIML